MITIQTKSAHEHQIHINGYFYCTLQHYTHAQRTKRQLQNDPSLPAIERALRKRERMSALAESRTVP